MTQLLDSAGVELMFRNFTPYLRRFLKYRTRRFEEIEDILQDTYLSALRHCATFKGESKPETWLTMIAKNAMLNRVERMHDHDDIDLMGDFDGALAQEEDVVDTCIRNQRLRAIGRAWEIMPEGMRSVAQMILLDEESYEDTANALDIPKNTVKSRALRGRTWWKNQVLNYLS